MPMFRKVFICCALSLLVLFESAAENNRFSADDFKIECTLDKNSLYEREPGMITVTLLTPTSDIADVVEVAPLELNHGNFASVSNVQVLDHPTKKRINGRDYLAVPVAKYSFTINEKGKYELHNAAYDVKVAYPVIVRDPFWGTVRTTETKSYRISPDKVSFRVRELPGVGDDGHFSGAVGNFSVKTIVPPGDIIVNEEATAIIEITGYGDIPENTLPEYRDAFGENAKLKSVSESRESYIRDGKLVTELRLECSFIPLKRDDVVIGEVSFEFFNPKNGKYETARSAPVEVEIKSSTVRRETMEI